MGATLSLLILLLVQRERGTVGEGGAWTEWAVGEGVAQRGAGLDEGDSPLNLCLIPPERVTQPLRGLAGTQRLRAVQTTPPPPRRDL